MSAIVVQIKSLKILMFSMTIYRRIRELWGPLSKSSFRIKFSIYFLSTSVRLKLLLFLYWFLTATIIEWFLYFRIAFKVESLTAPKKGSLFEYLVKILFYVEKKNKKKKTFRISKVSRSNFNKLVRHSQSSEFRSYAQFYQTRDFTVFQKSLLLMTDYSFKFS